MQAFLLLLFCPLNVVYRSSRFRFLWILRNIVLSPLCKVVQYQHHLQLFLISYSAKALHNLLGTKLDQCKV